MLFKVCKRCLVAKIPQEYSPNSHNKDKLSTYCKVCSAKHTALNRNPIKEAMRKYKISEETVTQLRSIANCQICGQSPRENKTLCIDHCHTSGKVRGILCDPCNTALGKFKDNITILKKAIEYLENSSTESRLC